MLRKLLLGIAAAATIGVAAFASTVSTPAAAQSLSGGYGYPGQTRHPMGPRYGGGPRWGGGGYYGRPSYGYGRPAYGYGYGRPAYGYGYGGPRCYYRPVRYWDGWGWVVRERRICR